MASLNIPNDYNWWYILSYAGVDPTTDQDKYSYDATSEVLTVDVAQDKLDRALAQYDHQAWLQELQRINAPSEIERLEAVEMAMLEMVIGGVE